ncbi:DUF4430 domain-containing protein [Lysinibacillus contaminans]|uniref:DUF4430 domain-containing protein n=1 Tax=Lysinibacillus contaminans TaxID=1293441 RepID=UPI0006AF6E8E|nr:DUF4430 domain-containing protein [Lysinibacillus contaminans]
MQKKWLISLLFVLLTCFLTACTIETVEKHQEQETYEKSVNKQDDTTTSENKKPDAQEDPNSESVEGTTPSDERTSEEEKEKQPSTDNRSQQNRLANKAENNAGKEKEDAQANHTTTVTPKPPTPKPNTEQPIKPVEEKKHVTIAIFAKTLLENWELLDPTLQNEKYVPKDGVILKTIKYELLSEKDTVWTILSRAVKEHNIQMEYQGANENIYNSVYIEGINHLYEFSAGELSGWMYKVNGHFPNYGSNQYVLKDGDIIEWHYTVDLGRDLGQNRMSER